MKSVILATIKHTGLNSMRAQARDLGYWCDYRTKIKIGMEFQKNGAIYSCHVYPNGLRYPSLEYWEEAVLGHLPLVTMRRPFEDIEQGFIKRGERLQEYKQQVKTWERVLLPVVDVIVDLYDPKEGLEQLSELTGVDWGTEITHHENAS